ncbi:MATE family efflux transporter [Prevotella sp. MGM1]|uniref:MATE family efflux transporter n=1 Tax=Prevotella sp. MGM1 TaxID=2033405 RepID=UPI000CEA4871|nr:MATE family efflux transporter [Prevotella sp. MGM1]GAY28304.1 MATE family efflux transporter [Prevotella sp. MGM1]
MWIQVLVAVVNIALDWYMIFSLDMGVKGAAVATSAACVFGGLMALAYFVRFSYKLRFYRLKLSVTSLLLSIRNVTYIMKIGFATFLTELAMGVIMLTGNYMFMSMLNEEGVAAFAVACYLFPIVFSISNAVAQSAQPIISFNHGVRSDARVARTLRVSLFTAAVCGTVVSLCLWIGAPAITALFLTPSEAAYGIALAGLPLFALCAVFFSVNIAFIGYYQSVERAMASTVFTSLRGMLLLVPSFVLLPHALGVSGLWLAIPTAEFLTLVSVSLFYLRQIKRSAA